ncbi:MAG TPA: hypothetical protein VL359_14410, partial [bacterium]|nr:hypothetical protein [bacterium]
MQLCTDEQMGFCRDVMSLPPGSGLTLDARYRLRHLPLVAPGHPRVIAREPGTDGWMGHWAQRIYSLILPVPWTELAASAPFGELSQALRGAPFAHKIAWQVAELRRERLHTTLCSFLGEGAPPHLRQSFRASLAGMGPLTVELRGLYSG